MKILLLFSIAALICINLAAQNRIQIPASIRNISQKRPMYQYNAITKAPGENQKTIKGNKSSYYEEIGQTVYDLQTYSSTDNRCYMYPDGSIGATWNISFAAPNFNDIGTGYNYFNGTSWGMAPATRIETSATGWPSYSHLGANGEIIVAHNDTQLVMYKRINKGTGIWTHSHIPTPVGTTPYWPHIAVSGNTIHVLAAHKDTSANGPVYQSQVNSLLYYRSLDGGTTWDKQAQIIPGLDAASGFTQGYGADIYSWAEPMGDTLAFVIGNSWTDLSLMKSVDGGDTWNKTIIFAHPYFNFKEYHTIADTIFVCDGHHAVSLDANGNAHVVFGIMKVCNNDTTDGLTTYFPATDGLAYWKESYPAFTNLNPDAVYGTGKLIAWVTDRNEDNLIFGSLSATFPNYGGGGLTSQPQISIDNNGDIYVVYSSIVEDMVSVGNEFYRHIWSRKYDSLTSEWGDFIELSDGLDFDLVECVYPAMSKTIENRINITCQIDFEPGESITSGDPDASNSIIHFNIDKIDFICSHDCNNIFGTVFNDMNSNGIRDISEEGVAGYLIKILPGPDYATSDQDGNFAFADYPGTYTATIIPQPFWDVTTDSLGYTFSFTDTNHVTGLNFGVKERENVQDMAVYLTCTQVQPGFKTLCWITYRNERTRTMAGNFYYTYDNMLPYLYCSPVADVQIGNNLEFHYDSIYRHEYRHVNLIYLIPDTMEIGDEYLTYSHILPLTGDTNVANNYDTLRLRITGPFDPNDKLVSPAGLGADGYVLHNTKLTYTVRFQNTGNDTAFTVVIKDTLDTDMNIETFSLLASSHPVTYNIQGAGIITFTFNNILLPDSNVNQLGSNGFVKYSVEPKAPLADFTQVKNKAYIYFDFNPPVVTNEVLTTYVSTLNSINQTGNRTEIKVYPNPASDMVTLNVNKVSNNNITLNIYTIMGKPVRSENIKQKQQQINVSNLPNGVYILEIKTNNQTEKQKLVIQR